jgi:hypothetical protein
MSVYAFTDEQGIIEVIVDCDQSQIDIQPHNAMHPLRFDVTGQIDGWQETGLLCVDIETGKAEQRAKPPLPEPTDEELAAEARLKRNDLLLASDWTQMPDAPVDHEAWAVYRQQLRDLPDNTEDPRNTVWPVKPN